jgi:lipid-binding SYLF domain-containing protein
MGTRSLRSLFSCLLAGATLASLPAAASAASEAEANRAASEKESKALVQRVIAACPGAKAMLRGSQGFATFTGVGAGAGGIGVARPTSTRQPVYMRFEGSGAAAAGSKRDLVFLFATRDAFSSFAVKGATLGGDAAAGEAGDCSQALAPGVRVIQIEGKRVVGGAVPSARYSPGSLN